MASLRAALLIGLVLVAPSARAEALRDEVKGLLRTYDCALSLDRLRSVFTVMGHEAAELETAVESLTDSGEAAVSPDGAELVLAPEVCRAPIPTRRRVLAVPWIEERLAVAPGCRMRIGELSDGAKEAGVAAPDFERAVRDLSALGRYRAEGGALALRDDLCGPGRAEDRPLARVEALGTESLRAVIGLLAMERACRLPLADRAALMRDLGVTAVERLNLGRDLSADAGAALERRLGEALEDPGPAYRIDRDGREIVAVHCRP